MPEGTKTIRETAHTATIYDLLRAYADQRRRTIKVGHVVKARPVWSIKDARLRLERFMGDVASTLDWLEFDRYLKQILVSGRGRQNGARELVRRDARDGARGPS